MAKKTHKKSSGPAGWYYMSDKELTVSDLAEIYDSKSLDIEVWKEAGVLEIGVEEKISIDVEACDLDLGDDFSNAFLEKHKIKSLFYVTFKQEEAELCLPYVKMLPKLLDGLLCGDTEDFTPIYS